MKMKMRQALLLLTALAGSSGAVMAADNMRFYGTLHAHACLLHPDDENIDIDFSESGTRDLYLRGGTQNQPFSIRLMDCNTAVAGEVQITFDGLRNPSLPGALALDPGSEASGVAIVLSDATQRDIRLGDPQVLPVTGSETTLQFHHRLQVEPDVLVRESIVSGTFQANTTFSLVYP
jgi:type 1 fimbria pilin